MLASRTSSSRKTPRRPVASRSMQSIYDSQRPTGVSRTEWSNVFDAFMTAWAKSLIQEHLESLAGQHTVAAA